MTTYAKIFETLLTSQKASGVTLSGGKVHFFVPGSVVDYKPIYLDRGKATPANNPFTLSADGTGVVYGDGLYDVQLTNAAGAVIATWEDVSLFDAGAWANSLSNYDSLADAVTAIGSTKTTLVIPTDTTVADNLTVPANISLDVINGALITIASGKVLTVNGSFRAELTKVFSGTGTVSFGSGSVVEVFPQWWGAEEGTYTDQTAYFHLALDAANRKVPVTVPSGKYAVNIVIDNNQGAWLRGTATPTTSSNVGVTLIPYSANSAVVTIGDDSTNIYGIKLDSIHVNSYMDAGLTTTGKIGVRLGGGAIHVTLKDVSINGAFSEYGLQILPGATKPVVYVYADGLKMQQDSGMPNLANIFVGYYAATTSYIGAISFNNFSVTGPSASGKALISDACDIIMSNGWFQVANNCGVQLKQTDSTYSPNLYCSNVFIDSDTSTDVVLETYETISTPPIIGQLAVDGYIKFSDANTYSLTGFKNTLPTPIIAYPTVQGAIYFNNETSSPATDMYMTRSSDNLSIVNSTGFTSINAETGVYLTGVGAGQGVTLRASDFATATTKYGVTKQTTDGRFQTGQILLNEIAAADASNGCIYVNSTDHKLYFKDSGGVARALY